MKIKIIASIFFLCLQAQAQGPSLAPAADSSSFHDFLFSDFGAINTHSLETHTLPKRVAMTALVLEGRSRGWIAASSRDYRKVLEKFGFITPQGIANAPATYRPSFKTLPLGLTEKEIRLGLPVLQVTGLNVTCATCHTGRLYDSQGKPTSQVWVGLPNTSINLELYTRSVYNGLKKVRDDVGASHKLMKTLFPETEFTELATLRTLVYNLIKKRVRHLEKTTDLPTPYSNGGPGITNGVGALKFTLNLFDRDQMQKEYGFTSIPALGDRFLRTSLLYDGVYSPLQGPRFAPRSSWSAEDESRLSAIVASFTIPTMGQSVKGVIQSLPQVQKVLHDVIGSYEAPPFPGDIHWDSAQRGGQIYSQSCAHCHGTYEWESDWQRQKPHLIRYPNRLVSQADMNTDPARWQSITPAFLKGVAQTDLSKILRAANTGGYVAPLLNSLWATAPYLHNGSVPTLWDLMHPQERPAKFMVGGHHLDYSKMGLKLQYDPLTQVWIYPQDVQAWSLPALYDTSQPGYGNRGHESPFDQLTEAEKGDLMEYLKLL